MTVLSHACDEGRHNRCLGVAYAHPPVQGRRTVPCECPTCQHQPEPPAATA